MKRRFGLDVFFNEKKDLINTLKDLIKEIEDGVEGFGIQPVGRCIALKDLVFQTISELKEETE